jgi:hypothetical protein
VPLAGLAYARPAFFIGFQMVQTYCTQTEIEQVLSSSGLLSRADDDETEVIDSGIVSAMINRGASLMNAYLNCTQYSLSDLANDEWCKWCNATLSAYLFATRRGNPAPNSLQDERDQYFEWLDQIRNGQMCLETAPTLETTPTVTNFRVQPFRGKAPVRRQERTSTGKVPPGKVKKFDANVFNDNS